VRGSSRFEEFLSPLLNQAADFSDDARELVDELFPEDSIVGTMPGGTVYRLHIAATATYRSGLLCLRAPETSVGTFSLLRGLLEAWSHLAFIADSTKGGDSRCRALRYERGAMREWADIVRNAPPSFDRDAWQQQHHAKQLEVDALWSKCRCSGSPRTYKHVTATLNTLAGKPRMEWIPEVWKATSATVHMYGVDYAFDSRGDGTSDLVWALPHHRATWLRFLAATYAYLTVTTATILCPDAAAIQEFHNAMGVLVANPELHRWASGERR
jgi:hypothetical protein